ncbi:MAG: hypothetical protein RSD67_02380 [Oscillospiraceae bacterium]
MKENNEVSIGDTKELVCGFSVDDNFYYVDTDIRKYVNKLQEFANLYPNDTKVISNQDGAISIKLSKDKFTFGLPHVKREVSDEQRQIARDRFKKLQDDGKLRRGE